MSIEELYEELQEKYTSNGMKVEDVFLDLHDGQLLCALDKQVYLHYVDEKGRGFYEENKRLCKEVMDYVQDKYPGQFYCDWSEDDPILSIEENPNGGLLIESPEDGDLGLTSREAYRMLGGRSAVDKFVARVNKDQPWWTVSIDPCIDEENPEDMDFLNVQIEMNYRRCKDLSPKYMEQREDVVTEQVWKFLNKRGLDFDYECNGDGAEGPIASYRVRLAD